MSGLEITLQSTPVFYVDFHHVGLHDGSDDSMWCDLDEPLVMVDRCLYVGGPIRFTDTFHECMGTVVSIDKGPNLARVPLVHARLDWNTWKPGNKFVTRGTA